MITEKTSVLEALHLDALREILESTGPCVTLLLPPYHPGEPAHPAAALLKADLQEAVQQLAERKFPKDISDNLLAPLKDLAADPASLTGSRRGRVVFLSLDILRQFQLNLPVQPSVTVAGCFAIRRVLPELSVPASFYILAVSKESVSLFRSTHHRVEAVELPRGVPVTLREAMGFKAPDHDLENRSAIGTSTGAMHAVRFGTGSGRETEHAHLADFYRMVDRGIQKLLNEPGIPLILAGVSEETAAYRSISTYRNLVSGSLRGHSNLSPQSPELLLQASSILRAEETEREAKAAIEAIERTTPGLLSSAPDAILHASFEGRVQELFVDDSSERRGIFQRGDYRSCGEEDLLNLAVVQTILHRGKAVELPTGLMPKGTVAVARMRF